MAGHGLARQGPAWQGKARQGRSNEFPYNGDPMTRQATIQRLVWNDDKFPFASDAVRLVWFHLMTTPMGNPLGCFKASQEGLAAEIRWPLKKYRETFREGYTKGFWKVSERFHVVYFRNYFRHNKPSNPNVLRGWLKYLDEIPQCDCKTDMIKQLKTFAKGWGEPFAKVTANLCEYTVTVTVTETVTDSICATHRKPSQLASQEAIATKAELEDGFASFWQAYPRRVDKAKAHRIWTRQLKPDLELTKKILAAVTLQANSHDWKKEKGKYVPYPTTYLNGCRWEDEISQTTGGDPGAQVGAPITDSPDGFKPGTRWPVGKNPDGTPQYIGIQPDGSRVPVGPDAKYDPINGWTERDFALVVNGK